MKFGKIIDTVKNFFKPKKEEKPKINFKKEHSKKESSKKLTRSSDPNKRKAAEKAWQTRKKLYGPSGLKKVKSKLINPPKNYQIKK